MVFLNLRQPQASTYPFPDKYYRIPPSIYLPTSTCFQTHVPTIRWNETKYYRRCCCVVIIIITIVIKII